MHGAVLKRQFYVAEKAITVYPGDAERKPVIYLNTVKGGGDQVFQALRSICASPFCLVTIDNLDWDHDMSPWSIPPISEQDVPCTGGADDYLRFLLDEIMPEAEACVQGGISWRGLAGYSLAGLFAVYSLYQTGVFSKIASISGSLWFPGILDYIQQNQFVGSPKCIYFSLGDRENKTTKPYLKVVQTNTEYIYSFLQKKRITSVFQLNSGGHHDRAAERTAKGIAWLLGEQKGFPENSVK